MKRAMLLALTSAKQHSDLHAMDLAFVRFVQLHNQNSIIEFTNSLSPCYMTTGPTLVSVYVIADHTHFVSLFQDYCCIVLFGQKEINKVFNANHSLFYLVVARLNGHQFDTCA